MTLSRSQTPTLAEKRALRESVQELDNLLEDLAQAQVSDETTYTKRLDQQSQMYSSTSGLNVPGGSAARSRPSSAQSGAYGRPSSSSPNPLRTIASDPAQRELEKYTSRLDAELNRNPEAIPRGVFVKDVVEEEILVDHVLVPKTQQTDKKFITRSSDRRQGGRRQVAFSERTIMSAADGDGDGDSSEYYDNTDTEQEPGASVARRYHTHQVGDSNLSLNSAATDQASEMHSDTSSVILDPNKIINCYTCGGRVVGQVITALGRNYHKEHFTCAHCQQELGTRNFYERDNMPYCERDYQQLFSPKCAACQEPILDKVTIALEQTFHPEHFVCAYCGCQFDVDDGFHEKDGKPYCKNDFFELFANKCAGCNLPITANYITALSVQWHPDCFVCHDCHCPFADGKFFDIDGLPYCEIHYHARRGSLCAVCRQPIIGKCTTAMFRKFHPDHFTCTYCLKVLSKSFKEENDKPYCHDCFDKLYS